MKQDLMYPNKDLRHKINIKSIQFNNFIIARFKEFCFSLIVSVLFDIIFLENVQHFIYYELGDRS